MLEDGTKSRSNHSKVYVEQGLDIEWGEGVKGWPPQPGVYHVNSSARESKQEVVETQTSCWGQET